MHAGDRSVGGPEPSDGTAPRASPARGDRQRSSTRRARSSPSAASIGGTVEDICERAGFTRGAFYSNFADKDDVLRALIEREHDSAARPRRRRLRAGGRDRRPTVDRRSARPVLASVADRLLRSVPDGPPVLAHPDRAGDPRRPRPRHVARLPRGGRAVPGADRRVPGARRSRVLGRELVVDARRGDRRGRSRSSSGARGGRCSPGPDADPNALARVMLPILMLALSRPRGGTA